MKHKIYYLVVILLVSLSWNESLGQDTLMISKSEILEKISQENLQLKIAETASASARADYKQSNSLFLPSITASHTAMVTTNPLMAFGSKLNQGIVTPADFDPTVLNDPGSTQNYATVLEFTQPLINADGLFERKAAKTTMEIYQLQSARTKEYLALEVSKAYMQLQLAHRAAAVLAKAYEAASGSLRMVNDYLDQGMLQKSDVLDVEIRVNEVFNQWESAKSNVQNASDYLSFLMNEPGGQKVYMPIDQMETTLLTIAPNLEVPESRKDLMAMNKSTEAYGQIHTARKMNLLPRLNAFGSFQMYDSKLFGTSAKGYLLGAQLSWTLFDGYKSIGQLEKKKLDYQRSQSESEQYRAQSDLELNKSLRQLTDTENKVKSSIQSHQLAQEAYRIKKDRFEQGLVKTNELMMAETLQFQKELEYLQNLFEYHFTKEYIDFLTK